MNKISPKFSPKWDSSSPLFTTPWQSGTHKPYFWWIGQSTITSQQVEFWCNTIMLNITSIPHKHNTGLESHCALWMPSRSNRWWVLQKGHIFILFRHFEVTCLSNSFKLILVSLQPTVGQGQYKKSQSLSSLSERLPVHTHPKSLDNSSLLHLQTTRRVWIKLWTYWFLQR